MQFEDLDNKIREAADHHHPAYDQTAWQKMQKLLDKHLPNNDNRRRLAFIILFCIGLGVGGFLILQNRNAEKPLATQHSSDIQQTTPPFNKAPAGTDKTKLQSS